MFQPKKQNMNNIIATLSLGSLLIVPQALMATTYTDAFPSSTSTVVSSIGAISATEFGYFWSVSRGDSITETFAGTGLPSVNQLDLAFPITQNFLNGGAQVNWQVSVNGTPVGNWIWKDTDGTGPFTSSYTFPDIAGAGTYTIGMLVQNEVASGLGSIAIGHGDMTLTGGGTAVPDMSSTLPLLGVGLSALCMFRRKN